MRLWPKAASLTCHLKRPRSLYHSSAACGDQAKVALNGRCRWKPTGEQLRSWSQWTATQQEGFVRIKLIRTLYPWLIPLMNCCGGGFQKNWMVVEFTASAWTFCGGAVGTAQWRPGNWLQAEKRNGGKERWKEGTFSRHSQFTGNNSGAKRDQWFMFRIQRSDFKRKLIGLFLIFCWKFFQWEEKGLKWFLWRTIPQVSFPTANPRQKRRWGWVNTPLSIICGWNGNPHYQGDSHSSPAGGKQYQDCGPFFSWLLMRVGCPFKWGPLTLVRQLADYT